MNEFKVGDKVRLKSCKRVREILCIDGTDVWLRCNDNDIPGDEIRCTWELSDIAGKVETVPAPPEGREVEPEKRLPKFGDVFWDEDSPVPWMKCEADFDNVKYYCLRPLPPKPEGEGWEWRKPVDRDEYQCLGMHGEPIGSTSPFDASDFYTDARLGCRWCRTKPKVKRWNDVLFDCHGLLCGSYPLIDTGTGPQLDEDKIVEGKWRAKAIEWLNEQPFIAAAEMRRRLLKELESQ